MENFNKNEIISYKKNVQCYGVVSDDLESDLETLKGMIFKYKSIPSVIIAGKNYKTFKINTEIDVKDGNKIILVTNQMLSKRFFIFKVEIDLLFDYFSYIEILSHFVPSECMIGAYETVGDIIHLNLTEKQTKYKEIIGFVLFKKTGKTVINKIGNIDNVYRNYNCEVLEKKDGFVDLKTIVVECNVKMVVDLENVYWSGRLQNERKMLYETILNSSQPKSVCDLFCGVGPHVLPLLKAGYEIFANDLNANAIECLKESLKLNKLHCKNIYNMDADLFINHIRNIEIGHFIFNLPEYSLIYLKLFLERYEYNGCMIHCYFFVKEHENLTELVERVSGIKITENILIKFVRDVSPSKKVYKMQFIK